MTTKKTEDTATRGGTQAVSQRLDLPQRADGDSSTPVTKHTPGPWSVGHMRPTQYGGGVVRYETPVHVGALGVGGGPGNCIAIVYLGGDGAIVSTPEATAANARLIAAAPELLELVRVVARWGVIAGASTDEYIATVHRCRELIAKVQP